MERFGAFEAGRVLDSGNGAIVYEARKEGDSKGRYVLKVFAPERLMAEEAGEERSALEPLFKDLGASFTSRVNLQKKAADSSPYFAPILAAGHDERGAWYVTRFYPRSIKAMLERIVALEAPDLFRVVQSAVRAALHLQRTAGRSHGNLKPSNIFVEGVRKPRSSRVVVADPQPGDAAEAERYEREDLRAIGQLIYQLVFKRAVDFAWVIVPLETSPEWARIFGKKTSAWLALCNRLLDPSLSLDKTNLASLEQDLRRLEPKPPVPVMPVGIAAGVLLVGGLMAFLLLHKRQTGTLIIGVEPEGARVVLTPLDEEDVEGISETRPAVKGVLKLVLKKGKYRIRAESPENKLEPSRRLTVRLDAGQTVRTNLSLAYGGLVVVSQPPGASFKVGDTVFHTPFTNYSYPPAVLDLQLQLEGYETTNLTVTVPTNHQVVSWVAQLRKPPPGSRLVEFLSDPPGAVIYVDGVSKGKASLPIRVSLEIAPHTIRAELPAPFAPITKQIEVVQGQNPSQRFYFPHGTLTVVSSTPPVLQIFLTNQLAGVSPTNLLLPPGAYELEFRASGFKTNIQPALVSDGVTNRLSPVLDPLGGFVDLTSDPLGAEIRDRTGKVLTHTLVGGMTRVPLARGTTDLVALFSGLDPVWRSNIIIFPGQVTNLGTFRFQYGRVSFFNSMPAEIGTNPLVRNASGALVPFGETVYQRPGQKVLYQVQLDDYQLWTNWVALAAGDLTTIPVRLRRNQIPMVLESNLRGAAYSYLDENRREVPLGQGTNFYLAWGTNVLVAKYGNLAPLRHTLVVPRSGSARDTFTFEDYGSVITTNLLAGTEIYQADPNSLVFQGRAPETIYARPGPATFLFVREGYTNQASTNVLRASWVVLTSPLPLPYRSKTSGLELMWVPGLPGTRDGGYVGRTHVTQGQYRQVMNANPSEPLPAQDDLPVNNVSAQDALTFCQRLTDADKKDPAFPGGCVYSLLTVAQWDQLKLAADPSKGIFSAPRPALPLDRPKPDESAVADAHGIFGVYGNVDQICFDQALPGYRAKGGRYTDTAASFKYRFTDTFSDPSRVVGFRVVLIPPAK
ncbi:MAG TPA: PEGA domain-containing protein [Verrucomicrobiae bacterium]|nr:PEGA domain-containing protein [Verrucomicrobiae bacterium]